MSLPTKAAVLGSKPTKMAGEVTPSSSGHKRRGKLSRQESHKKDSDIETDKPTAGVSNDLNTRGGLRVYKIVVLGDGGVGKSGITLWLNLFVFY